MTLRDTDDSVAMIGLASVAAVVLLIVCGLVSCWSSRDVKPLPDAVIGYERLDDVGYIYTARHRGHLYIGAVVHAGVALLHSPECDCRTAEAAE